MRSTAAFALALAFDLPLASTSGFKAAPLAFGFAFAVTLGLALAPVFFAAFFDAFDGATCD